MERGQRIGDFEVLLPLDAGGTSEVYLVESLRTSKKAAAKVLARRHRQNERLRNLLGQEARVLSELTHPNLVRLIEAETEGELVYLITEWIPGANLEERLQAKGPPKLEVALGWMRDCAQGLAFAHQHQVLHRDLKPENIRIDHDGTARLLDFGLARSSEEMLASAPGRPVGTLLYNAPEINKGEPASFRSDLYSLGLVFDQLLTGKPVFQSKNLADLLLEQVDLDRDWIPPSGRGAKCPPEIDALIQKLCEYHPEDRPESVDEILLTLDLLNQPEAELSEPPSAPATDEIRDQADTHYWKGLNRIAEGDPRAALDEFEQVLHLSAFDPGAFTKEVRIQLQRLELELEAASRTQSSPPRRAFPIDPGEDLGTLELDLLERLHDLKDQEDGPGLRTTMSNLLRVYKQGLATQASTPPGKSPEALSAEDRVYLHHHVSRLYRLLADRDRAHSNLRRCLQILEGEELHEARKKVLFEELFEDAPTEPLVLEFVVRQARWEKDPAKLSQALGALAREHARRHDFALALRAYEECMRLGPPPEEILQEAKAVEESLHQLSEQTERFFGLVDLLEKVEDRSSAINMCRRFSEESSPDPRILERLCRLEEEQGLKKDASETRTRWARLLLERRELPRARALLGEALQGHPKNRQALALLTELLIEEDPTLAQLQDPKEVRREILIRLKLPREASRDLRERIETRPNEELLERVESIYRHGKDPATAAYYARKRIEWALDEEEDLLLVRRLVQRFESLYPDYRSHLRALSGHALLVQDPRLMTRMLQA